MVVVNIASIGQVRSQAATAGSGVSRIS